MKITYKKARRNLGATALGATILFAGIHQRLIDKDPVSAPTSVVPLVVQDPLTRTDTGGIIAGIASKSVTAKNVSKGLDAILRKRMQAMLNDAP